MWYKLYCYADYKVSICMLEACCSEFSLSLGLKSCCTIIIYKKHVILLTNLDSHCFYFLQRQKINPRRVFCIFAIDDRVTCAQCIRCRLATDGLAWFVPICWSRSWALQKRLNRSRCRLVSDSGKSKEPCIGWGNFIGCPAEWKALGVSAVVLYAAKNQ